MMSETVQRHKIFCKKLLHSEMVMCSVRIVTAVSQVSMVTWWNVVMKEAASKCCMLSW